MRDPAPGAGTGHARGGAAPGDDRVARLLRAGVLAAEDDAPPATVAVRTLDGAGRAAVTAATRRGGRPVTAAHATAALDADSLTRVTATLPPPWAAFGPALTDPARAAWRVTVRGVVSAGPVVAAEASLHGSFGGGGGEVSWCAGAAAGWLLAAGWHARVDVAIPAPADLVATVAALIAGALAGDATPAERRLLQTTTAAALRVAHAVGEALADPAPGWPGRAADRAARTLAAEMERARSAALLDAAASDLADVLAPAAGDGGADAAGRARLRAAAAAAERLRWDPAPHPAAVAAALDTLARGVADLPAPARDAARTCLARARAAMDGAPAGPAALGDPVAALADRVLPPGARAARAGRTAGDGAEPAQALLARASAALRHAGVEPLAGVFARAAGGPAAAAAQCAGAALHALTDDILPRLANLDPGEPAATAVRLREGCLALMLAALARPLTAVASTALAQALPAAAAELAAAAARAEEDAVAGRAPAALLARLAAAPGAALMPTGADVARALRLAGRMLVDWDLEARARWLEGAEAALVPPGSAGALLTSTLVPAASAAVRRALLVEVDALARALAAQVDTCAREVAAADGGGGAVDRAVEARLRAALGALPDLAHALQEILEARRLRGAIDARTVADDLRAVARARIGRDVAVDAPADAPAPAGRTVPGALLAAAATDIVDAPVVAGAVERLVAGHTDLARRQAHLAALVALRDAGRPEAATVLAALTSMTTGRVPEVAVVHPAADDSGLPPEVHRETPVVVSVRGVEVCHLTHAAGVPRRVRLLVDGVDIPHDPRQWRREADGTWRFRAVLAVGDRADGPGPPPLPRAAGAPRARVADPRLPLRRGVAGAELTVPALRAVAGMGDQARRLAHALLGTVPEADPAGARRPRPRRRRVPQAPSTLPPRAGRDLVADVDGARVTRPIDHLGPAVATQVDEALAALAPRGATVPATLRLEAEALLASLQNPLAGHLPPAGWAAQPLAGPPRIVAPPGVHTIAVVACDTAGRVSPPAVLAVHLLP